MKPTHDIVAVTGTYKDRDGVEKKRRVKCGVVLTRDDGSMSLKIESLPVGNDWNGFLNIYPIEEQPRQERNAQQQTPQHPPRVRQATPPPIRPMEDEDDIPF